MKAFRWSFLFLCLCAASAYATDGTDSDFLTHLEQVATLPVLFIFFTLIISTYVSEDLTCAMAGLLVARGHFELIPAILACIIGIFTGDLLLVLLGRFVNAKLLDRFPMNRIIQIRKVRAAEAWFEKRGPFAVFISRFVPGTRFPTYVTAGMLKMPFRQFALFFLSASIIWTPFLVITSTKLGEQVLPLMDKYAKAAPLILLSILGILWIVFKLLLPLLTHTGRRMLVGQWRRLTGWEFWPPWVFYFPMVPAWAYLMMRYRSTTVFTASNPMLADGGFINESKTEILKRLDAEDPEWLPFRLLAAADSPMDRFTQLVDFLALNHLNFPVVLKPDRGQRGAGVSISRTPEQARQILEQNSGDLIAQAFSPGIEFGVFYIRSPQDERGRIFSITEKVMLKITGNGHDTLKRLILDDARAVCMCEYHFDQWAERLYEVPAQGELIQLTELGTHCKGALFLNANELITPALETRIDEISQKVDGFYFGRYDIRCPSRDHLMNALEMKIIELNGVTSEATHIYDPATPLLEAYRVLYTQWNHAFSIGRINQQQGHAVMSLSELYTQIRNYHPPEKELKS